MSATARLVSASATAAQRRLEGRGDEPGQHGASSGTREGDDDQHRASDDAVEGDEAHSPEQEGLDRDDGDGRCGGEEVAPEAVGGAVPLADELRSLLAEEPERLVQSVEEVGEPHDQVAEDAASSLVEAEAVVGVVQFSHQRDAADEHRDEDRREHREREGEDLVLPGECHEEAEELPDEIGEGADTPPQGQEGKEGNEETARNVFHGSLQNGSESNKKVYQKNALLSMQKGVSFG